MGGDWGVEGWVGVVSHRKARAHINWQRRQMPNTWPALNTRPALHALPRRATSSCSCTCTHMLFKHNSPSPAVTSHVAFLACSVRWGVTVKPQLMPKRPNLLTSAPQSNYFLLVRLWDASANFFENLRPEIDM